MDRQMIRAGQFGPPPTIFTKPTEEKRKVELARSSNGVECPQDIAFMEIPPKSNLCERNMKAVICTNSGEKIDYAWTTVPDPECGPDDVIIKTHAVGINRGDLVQASGFYPPPPGVSDILGLEISGEVEALGSNVKSWQLGNQVAALLPGGGYAEKVVCHSASLLPIPKNWTFEQAAGLPEAFITAYSNLMIEGELMKDENVLVHSGASGVGLAAIQLAKKRGAYVFATAGTDEKCKYCQEMGAEIVVNYRREDWYETLKSHKLGGNIDLILDTIGGSYFEHNINILRFGGRLMTIGLLGGSQANINLVDLLMKNLSIQGTTLRNKTPRTKQMLIHAFINDFWPAIEEGEILPNIDRTYPISDVEEAHAYMKYNKNIGKIILTI